MTAQRRAAIALWAALTFSCAVVVHGVVHAVGSQSFVWDSPAHVVMLGLAAAMLAGVAVPMGLFAPGSERRRRLALVRAGLVSAGPQLAGFGLLVQAAIAGSLLVAEGASLEPERLGVAVLCGLIALLCSAILFRTTREVVVSLLIAFAAAVAPTIRRAVLRRSLRRPARATTPYRLFIPNRPPPPFAL